MYKKLFLLVTLFISISVACDDSFKSNIPDAQVNLVCDLTNHFAHITTSGQFLTVTKTTTGYLISYPNKSSQPVNTQKAQYSRLGYAGLIIGNSTYNGYCAFDLACPVEGNVKASLMIKSDGFGVAVCPKCGTEYDLNNGGIPVNGKGEGQERLKPYTATLVSNGTELNISNQ